MLQRFRAAADRIERLGYRLLGALLATMSLLIAWQAIQRKLLGSTQAWTETLAIDAMFWLALVGAALGLRRGSHIAIEYFARKLDRLAGRAIAALVWLAELLFAAFLVGYGWRLSVTFMSESSPGTHLPVGLVDLALPVGGALMIVFLVEQAAFAWSRRAP